MQQDMPTTATIVHTQAELLEGLNSLLHQIHHEGLKLSTHSFEFADKPHQRLSLEFEALNNYLGACLEGFAPSAIHLYFTRYIPRSLLEGVRALLEARHYIVASAALTEA